MWGRLLSRTKAMATKARAVLSNKRLKVTNWWGPLTTSVKLSILAFPAGAIGWGVNRAVATVPDPEDAKGEIMTVQRWYRRRFAYKTKPSHRYSVLRPDIYSATDKKPRLHRSELERILQKELDQYAHVVADERVIPDAQLVSHENPPAFVEVPWDQVLQNALTILNSKKFRYTGLEQGASNNVALAGNMPPSASAYLSYHLPASTPLVMVDQDYKTVVSFSRPRMIRTRAPASSTLKLRTMVRSPGERTAAEAYDASTPTQRSPRIDDQPSNEIAVIYVATSPDRAAEWNLEKAWSPGIDLEVKRVFGQKATPGFSFALTPDPTTPTKHFVVADGTIAELTDHINSVTNKLVQSGRPAVNGALFIVHGPNSLGAAIGGAVCSSLRGYNIRVEFAAWDRAAKGFTITRSGSSPFVANTQGSDSTSKS